MARENLIIRRNKRFVLVSVDHDKAQCLVDCTPQEWEQSPGQFFYGGTGPNSIERAARHPYAITYPTILALREANEDVNGTWSVPTFRRAVEFDR